jgi:hypothetical protein
MKKLLLTTLFFLAFPLAASASTQVFTAAVNRGTPSTASTTVGLFGYGVNSTTIMPHAGTFETLRFYVYSPPTGAGIWTAVLQDGGSSKAITCQVTSSSPTNVAGWGYCSDTIHTFGSSAGDTMDISVGGAGGVPASNWAMSIDFTPTVAGNVVFSPGGGTTNVSTNIYSSIAVGGSGTSETTVAGILPEGGAIQNLYETLAASASPGNYVFTLRDFSSNATSSLTCTITATSCTDLNAAHAFSTSSPPSGTNNIGDRLDIAIAPNSSPTSRGITLNALTFVPNTIGDFDFIGANTTDTNATRYYGISGGGISAIEASTTQPVDAMTITSMQVYLPTSVGSGTKQRTFTLRDNFANTSATCAVVGSTNPNQCSWNGSITVAAGDLLDISDVPLNSPATSANFISIVATMPPPAKPSSVQSKNEFFGGFFRLVGGFFRIH